MEKRSSVFSSVTQTMFRLALTAHPACQSTRLACGAALEDGGQASSVLVRMYSIGASEQAPLVRDMSCTGCVMGADAAPLDAAVR